MLPGQAPEPARRQEAHALRGLRLGGPRLPVSLAASAGSGLLLWLALPPADLWPLGLVALVPALWALRGARARRGALVGSVFGFVFYGVTLGWLTPLSILGWAALCLVLAAWHAGLFAVVTVVWRDDRPLRTAAAVGAAWGLFEWLRSSFPFDGWNWTGLGATAVPNRLLIPAGSVLGELGLSAVLAAVNALLLAALVRRGRRSVRPLAAAAVLVVAPVAIPLPAPDGPPTDVAVVQGNVPLELGTASRIIEDQVVAESHAALDLELAADPPDLVVWPENAVDRDPRRDPRLQELVGGAVRAVGSWHLIGAITETDDGRLRNEDLLYDPAGRLVDRYAKIHLLPFGEFVPFREFLDWIPDVRLVREDLSAGDEPGRFRIPTGEFAAVICFENAFADLVRETVTPDSRFLVVSTNNSTFGLSAAPEQHLRLSQLRAVETGRWVVHAALSGISGVIAPSGRVVQRTGLFEPAVLRASIPAASGRTPYDAIGGWLPVVFLLILAAAYLTPRRAGLRPVPPLVPGARTTVVLPTYNERDTVEEAIDRILAVSDRVEVTVVDDSSPDGTGDVVRKLAEREARVALVERPEKGGLASAYLDGFLRALADGTDLVVEMDADLSHRPEELTRILGGAADHHVVIGSRYVQGGVVRNWSPVRRALSRGGNWYVRLLLGLPVADSTSGYRAYRREALRELVTHRLRSEGYGFQIELAYRAWRRGMSVGEVPITFEERRHGHSKISRAIVLEALWQVFLWAVRDRLFRRRPPSRERHPSAQHAPA